ncbi:MAG: hypothetical protein E6G46_06130 [Actinobacteria bacterium]|nr:MAG: hypothetical protein E6G46_06130 [Actinomycetota bacterium]
MRHEIVERHRLVGNVERHGCSNLFRALPATDRKVGKLLEQLNPEIERALTQLARALRIPVEVAERLWPVHMTSKINPGRRKVAPTRRRRL